MAAASVRRRQQRHGESPPDGGFRRIGKPRKSSADRSAETLRAEMQRAETSQAETVQAGAAWGTEIIVGFSMGMVLPVMLALAWAPPPPPAQDLFDVVTSVVKNPPQQWGCSGSTSPGACDEWLECAKMQEVARVGEETAEEVMHYHSQRFLSSAVLCNQNFVGACGVWWPEQVGLLGPTFSQALASEENDRSSLLSCRQLLKLVAAGRRAKQSAMSMFTTPAAPIAPALLSKTDLETRAQSALDDEVEKLRQKVDEDGGELVFIPDKPKAGEEVGE